MPKFLKDTRFWFFLIFCLAAILRFYRLPEYLQFLGDEGRDVLVVKHMIVNHQWTLLGPTASVGGFYIGPIYYYFMLPFLWLFGLDPVGPAVMAVLFGLATVVLVYIFCRAFFNERTALLAAFLMAISPKMTYISRFSWNPNPVPFFALLGIGLLYLAVIRKKKLYTFLSGIVLGVMFQLHYMDLVFIPIIFLTGLLVFPVREWLLQTLAIVAGFLVGDSLFLLFEIRHGFPNTKTMLEFITRRGGAVGPRSFNFLWLFDAMLRRLYETVLGFRGYLLDFFYYFSVAGFSFWAIRRIRARVDEAKIKLLLVWLFVGVLGMGSYRGQLLDHYFGFLYPLPFIFLGVTFSYLTQKRAFWPILAVFLALLTFMEINNMYFWQPPNNLVAQTKTVDQIVLNLADNKPYNFALLSLGNSDHAYRYFLEIWGKPPITIESPQVDPERKTVTDQLIAVCEQGDCKPLGNPLWEVAGFGRGEIAGAKQGPAGITVYKLVHYMGK